MALASGSPVRRSHRTAVSRWLAMPTLMRSEGTSLAGASASEIVETCCARFRLRRAQPSQASDKSAHALFLPSQRSRLYGRKSESASTLSPGQLRRHICSSVHSRMLKRHASGGNKPLQLLPAPFERCKPSLDRRQSTSSGLRPFVTREIIEFSFC